VEVGDNEKAPAGMDVDEELDEVWIEVDEELTSLLQENVETSSLLSTATPANVTSTSAAVTCPVVKHLHRRWLKGAM